MKIAAFLAKTIFSDDAVMEYPISRKIVENDKEGVQDSCLSLHNCVDIKLGHNLQKSFKMRKTLEIQAFLDYSMVV